MDAFTTLRHPRGQTPRTYRRRNRYIRNGECAAALRADTAARILLGRLVEVDYSLADVSRMCGSNVHYVAAAITLIESENTSLMSMVRQGRVPLLDAAASVKKRVALVKAYREATPDDLAALARSVGPSRVFDEVVSPALS
jgi:hypothetical protein